MKITKSEAVREDRDEVKSRNYKLGIQEKYQSVVIAELKGPHGEVVTGDIERVYYISDGKGEFRIWEEIIPAATGEVMIIPPKTKYDYRPMENETLKVILFMELWDN